MQLRSSFIPKLHRVLTGLVMVLSSGPVVAQSGAPQLAYTLFAAGLTRPVDIARAPGEARLFVVEKAGRVRIVTAAGAVLPTAFLNISARVGSTGSEQGLLGAAFHPNYATNGWFFVNYTDLSGNTRISRFQRQVGTADLADPASEVVLFTAVQPFTNHNGGSMHFGPDGYLYAALGDGGSGGDPGNRAQNLALPLGKVLRFDVDGGTPGGAAYSIPPTNPLVNTAGALPEIWAWGVRNPWRTSFDAATGDYWIADVGQNLWEEVNVFVDSAGANHNFGWRCYEGTVPFNLSLCGSTGSTVAPVFVYPHNNLTGGFSITGGYVYRGQQFPSLQGYYVCVDFVSGNLWTIRRQRNVYQVQRDTVLSSSGISAFGQDAAGELYVAEFNTGRISRLVVAGTTGLAATAKIAPLQLWPNPATGTCRVELPEAVSAAVEIVSPVTGQIVRRTRATAATAAATLDVGGLPPGLYHVRAWLPDGPRTQRLVVAAAE